MVNEGVVEGGEGAEGSGSVRKSGGARGVARLFISFRATPSVLRDLLFRRFGSRMPASCCFFSKRNGISYTILARHWLYNVLYTP